MMRTMRASAKWIFLVLAVAFVGWMVFEVGMDLSVQGQGIRNTDAVLRVNGTKVDLQTYYAALRNAQEQQRLQAGSAPESLEGQRALEDAVVENLIRDILLQQEFRRRGIRVTDDEIRQAAQNSPPPEFMSVPDFQTDGQFDLAKYRAYLATTSDPQFLFGLEQRYRQQIPESKLVQQLTGDLYVSDAKLWSMFRDQHDSVTFRMLEIRPPVAFADSEVTVTDEEIRQYYADHREDFSRPAVAYTSYVSVSRLTNAADTAAARERVERLKGELDAGADFATLAAQESADSGGPGGTSASNGGDLGWVPRGTFVDAFEEAALALRPGQTSDPVETEFGYHIIRLEGRTADSLHAAHILIPVELAGDHLIGVEAQADTLDLLAAEQEDPTALDDVADMLDLDIRVAPPVAEGNRLVLLSGLVVPDAGMWAFDAIPGETSPVIEAPEAFYVFRLDSARAAGVPPLAEVEDAVRRAVVNDKKWERARTLAADIAQGLQGGQYLMDAALQHVLNATTLGPMTRTNPAPALFGLPEVVGAAFGLGVGEAGGPVETPSGIFFVEPVAKQLADSSAFVDQIEAQRAQVLRGLSQERVQRFLMSLRNAADVDDRRRAIERLQRDLEDLAEQNPLNPLGF